MKLRSHSVHTCKAIGSVAPATPIFSANEQRADPLLIPAPPFVLFTQYTLSALTCEAIGNAAPATPMFIDNEHFADPLPIPTPDLPLCCSSHSLHTAFTLYSHDSSCSVHTCEVIGNAAPATPMFSDNEQRADPLLIPTPPFVLFTQYTLSALTCEAIGSAAPATPIFIDNEQRAEPMLIPTPRLLHVLLLFTLCSHYIQLHCMLGSHLQSHRQCRSRHAHVQ
jgi:hypothetical protein